MMALTSLLVTISLAQNINKAEYFVDHDPGQGNGTLIPIATPGETVNFPANIPLSGLPDGFHFLGIRVCDVEGKWSRYDYRSFYIFSSTPGSNVASVTTAEYFFDSDPGPGGGTPTSVGTSGSTVTFTASIPENLSVGFHWLGIRTKDSEGKWGLYDRREFYLTGTAVDMTGVAAAEYFFDHDPGAGNGSPIALNTPAYVVTQTFAIPTSGLSSGGHLLVMRVKDQRGNWGLFVKDSINVGNATVTISCHADTTITAAAGQCTAVVNGIDATVTPQGSSYTYTLSGATTGTGTGTASGKTFNPGVTTVTYAVTNAPQTSCSFKVTVIPNATASVTISTPQTTICQGQLVTFTAASTNPGTNPAYEWTVNGSVVGTSSNVYQTSSLTNGSVVKVAMLPYGSCAGNAPVYSNTITMTVTAAVAPSVSIVADQGETFCNGSNVSFTATPTNGGNSPAYAWTVNGSTVGNGTSNYSSSSLKNGDVVIVTMTSSLGCASPSQVASNAITLMESTVTPLVDLGASATTICPGVEVRFIAAPHNGGNNPTYQWKVNGISVGTNSNAYQSNTLSNQDVVSVTMTSSLGCANPKSTTNSMTITVRPTITPYVVVEPTQVSICKGTLVTLVASPVNGGVNPSYQWKLNGNNVGSNSDTYQSSSLSNNDVVSVVMTSSIACASPLADTSNIVTAQVFSTSTYYRDLDGDGFGNAASGTIEACSSSQGYVSNNTDCNDSNPTVHPGAMEICGNNIDDDCDGQVDETCETSPDNDGDGYTIAQGDCNDNKASIHPGAPEICGNGIDDDCDGQVDEDCVKSPDNDGDGYTVEQGDCNDNNASVHPGATEICGNGIDDNCDGQVDENCAPASLPTLIVRTYPVIEGNAGVTMFKVVVSLSTVAIVPVTVRYSTSDADAVAGLDYAGTSGTLTIPAGSSRGTIEVKIIGDLLQESNERFSLNFTDPVNVILGSDPRSRIMIIDDDKAKMNSRNIPINTITRNGKIAAEESFLKIPSTARRNQVWVIPQIERYHNEVLIMDNQGQLIRRIVNYGNHTSIGNVSAGIYFYQIRTSDGGGQVKYYSGRLLITE